MSSRIVHISLHSSDDPYSTLFRSHICELEIDPETGVTEIVAYTIVDDFGVTVNPMLLTGQVHGGTVQGIGQALRDRKSTRLNSSHVKISYAVCCLKKKRE